MEEIVQCPACGTKVVPGKEFCTACGGAMSPTARPTASAQAPLAVPPPPVDLRRDERLNHWVKRHKGLSIFLAIAVVVGGIGIISSLSNSDTQQSSGSADGVAAVASCSPETLQDLMVEYIALGNRTSSAYNAIPDVLTPAVGSKRLKIRFARESAQYQKIMNECVTVSDSNTGAELLVATTALRDADSALYTYYESYLDTEIGTIKGVNQRQNASFAAVEPFNVAWTAFGKEHGFFETLEDPPAAVDESKVAD